MHEVGLMHEILWLAETAAKQADMLVIHKVKVVVGSETAVMPDALQFAFEMLKRKPFAESAVLELETRSGRDFYVEYVEGE